MNASTQPNWLPFDLDSARLVGRMWRHTEAGEGPCVIAIRRGEVFDITESATTMADLLDRADRVQIASQAPGEALGPVTELLTQTRAARACCRLSRHAASPSQLVSSNA